MATRPPYSAVAKAAQAVDHNSKDDLVGTVTEDVVLAVVPIGAVVVAHPERTSVQARARVDAASVSFFMY